MTYSGDPPLICVGWEFATYGDPLHDLATHLVRMRYPAFQWAEVIDAWVRRVQAVRPAAANGLAKELRYYVDFERACAAYTDVIRAAGSLRTSFDSRGLDAAATAVRSALGAAADPLGLARVPGADEIEGALHRWELARVARQGGVLPDAAFGWERDRRIPASTAASAPSSLTSASFAAPRATATTRASRAWASWISSVPMPPEAPRTRTRSVGPTAVSSSRPVAVTPSWTRAAAGSRSRESGTAVGAEAGATARSA
jgi:hypothetical protein